MRLSALIVGVVVVLPHPAVAQDKFFDSNGVRIRYVDQGRGDPILLLHGQANNIETAWIDTGVLADLTKDHRVIAMDARGHGKSDKPHYPKAYGEDMAHDVVRLLDHLKIPRAHIVGYSMGGAINMKLLTMHPERYLTAVVGGHSGRRSWTPEEAKAAAEEAADLTGDTPFRAQILRAAPPNKPPTEAEISAITKLILDNNDPVALAAVVRARRGHLISEAELTRVKVPLLAIVGTADPAIGGVRQLKTLLPAMAVVELEGAVHQSNGPRGALRQASFVGAIRDFIREHRQPVR